MLLTAWARAHFWDKFRKMQTVYAPIVIIPSAWASYSLWWLVLCQLDTVIIIFKEETSSEKMSPPYWSVGKTVVRFLHGWLCPRSQFTVGGASSGLLFLGAVRKPREQVSKQQSSWTLHYSMPLASCPDAPGWWTARCKRWNKHSPPGVAFVHGVLSH